MTDDSHDGAEPARCVLAVRLEAERSIILADYARALDALDNPVAGDPTARAQTIAHASQSLTDIARSMRAGRVLIEESASTLTWDIGQARAAQAISTRESWRAAMVFVETVVHWAIPQLDADSLETFEIALLTLTQSITMRVREATGAYTSYLLNRIHEAHLGERQRIARELHDRVGDGLSVAHRQLELFHVYQESEPVKAAARAERAHQAVLESLESLRSVITDLRLEAPFKSLEKALASYLDAMPMNDSQLQLRVNGDETWVPATVRGEAFLIIKEAIRNALNHGVPDRILITVDIAPDELRAVVEDTGRGFDQQGVQTSGTAGLSSMRERAALLGGSVSVVSRLGQGTQVELTVPLPEHRAEGG